MTINAKILRGFRALAGGDTLELSAEDAARVGRTEGGETVEVVTLADADRAAKESAATARAEGVTEGQAKGAAAERERTKTVFASDAAKAHYPTAAFMLASNPGASADEIIAHLADMPKGTAAAGGAAGKRSVTETPNVDLGTPKDHGSGEASNDDRPAFDSAAEAKRAAAGITVGGTNFGVTAGGQRRGG